MSSNRVAAKKARTESLSPMLFPHVFELSELDSASEYLQERGYVVVGDVMSEVERLQGLSLLWDYLEGLGTGISRNDPRTWENANWIEIFSVAIAKYDKCGQSEFMWFARRLPAVHRCFAAFYGKSDLLVSMDGFVVTRPPSVDKKWITKGFWPHFDFNKFAKEEKYLTSRSADCIQSAVYFVGGSAPNGAFACVPGGHLRYDEYMATMDSKVLSRKDHYLPIAHDSPILDKRVRIQVPEGAALFWLSKLPHWTEPCEHPTGSDLKRTAAFVSMYPRCVLRDAEYEALMAKRWQAFRNGDTTSHWAILCQKNNRLYPRHSSFKTPAPSVYKKDFDNDPVGLALMEGRNPN
jgi:hypothetical protein